MDTHTQTGADARDVLSSGEFRRMVENRWRVSLALTSGLFLLYYGYILLIGLNKPFLAQRIGEVTTLGIPLGMAVIVGAWALTGAYVIWANRRHDAAVRALRARLQR